MNLTEFVVGKIVYHPSLGKGKVTTVDSVGEHKVRIKFAGQAYENVFLISSPMLADMTLVPVVPKKATVLNKYPWSSDVLDKFKAELPSVLKVDKETSVAAVLITLGVWTQADADAQARYDHQKRLLRQAMYEVGASSSHAGYMFAVSEDAKMRSDALRSQLHGE